MDVMKKKIVRFFFTSRTLSEFRHKRTIVAPVQANAFARDIVRHYRFVAKYL